MNKYYTPITDEGIANFMADIFKDMLGKKMSFLQSCKGRGLVVRTSDDLNLCKDPTCTNCTKYKDLLKKEFKMEGKYYTPTIEEFHVGFEYEELAEGKWISTSITQVCDLEYPEDDIEHDLGVHHRVKYLSQEDIESLGFEWKYSDKDGRTYMTYCKEDITIKEYYNNPNEFAIVRQLKNTQRMLFDGFIKNKSELKTLLKQLGI